MADAHTQYEPDDRRPDQKLFWHMCLSAYECTEKPNGHVFLRFNLSTTRNRPWHDVVQECEIPPLHPTREEFRHDSGNGIGLWVGLLLPNFLYDNKTGRKSPQKTISQAIIANDIEKIPEQDNAVRVVASQHDGGAMQIRALINPSDTEGVCEAIIVAQGDVFYDQQYADCDYQVLTSQARIRVQLAVKSTAETLLHLLTSNAVPTTQFVVPACDTATLKQYAGQVHPNNAATFSASLETTVESDLLSGVDHVRKIAQELKDVYYKETPGLFRQYALLALSAAISICGRRVPRIGFGRLAMHWCKKHKSIMQRNLTDELADELEDSMAAVSLLFETPAPEPLPGIENLGIYSRQSDARPHADGRAPVVEETGNQFQFNLPGSRNELDTGAGTNHINVAAQDMDAAVQEADSQFQFELPDSNDQPVSGTGVNETDAAIQGTGYPQSKLDFDSEADILRDLAEDFGLDATLLELNHYKVQSYLPDSNDQSGAAISTNETDTTVRKTPPNQPKFDYDLEEELQQRLLQELA